VVKHAEELGCVRGGCAWLEPGRRGGVHLPAAGVAEEEPHGAGFAGNALVNGAGVADVELSERVGGEEGVSELASAAAVGAEAKVVEDVAREGPLGVDEDERAGLVLLEHLLDEGHGLSSGKDESTGA